MYPYENPQTAFAVVLERGPNEGARSATHVIWESFKPQTEVIEMDILENSVDDSNEGFALPENEL